MPNPSLKCEITQGTKVKVFGVQQQDKKTTPFNVWERIPDNFV